ncbi:hypothetical protein HYO65_gp081 [Tenacibaculum phage PTm1]|uniref:Uncharacterized protein n=2 Tax=Shirahamavirus PTm1 TaxID=2846435 RepID=A0A5S9C0Y0_9CAUD|nr:hypothetical protein HYO65_gp081 [Tenacibaculum phage PTm1]BBI90473.1 hypothetical protein [Tenacibaculum phage PTm1]BBI90779.1 hypothetical protein [Tenacibaculum phage PTm5]
MSNEIYELANQLSDKEVQEKYNNLPNYQKQQVDTLFRLGDSLQLAYVTVIEMS